jgi:uncharacterized membrane protein
MMAALLLGVIAGLRTFTAPAVLRIFRRGGTPAYGLCAFAILEYGVDLYPYAPPRTSGGGLIARLLSGACCGWALAADDTASSGLGAVLGAGGAAIGAYLGLAARTRAISLVGRVPAALMEDAVAILGAILIVVYG